MGMNLWPALAAAYAVLSVVTFIVYGLDKSAAKAGRRRVAEATLHLLALVGGWPGAFVGQRIFRHKTCKPAFQRTFWLTAIPSVALFALMLKVSGLV